MHESKVKALLVYRRNNQGQKIFDGLITSTDIYNAFHQQRDGGYVKDIRTPADNVVTVMTNTSLQECDRIMQERNFNHLPVLKTKEVTEKNPAGEEIIVGFTTVDGKEAEIVIAGMISSLDIMVHKEKSRIRAAEVAREMPAS